MIDVQGLCRPHRKIPTRPVYFFAPRCGPARRADRNPVLRHLPIQTCIRRGMNGAARASP